MAECFADHAQHVGTSSADVADTLGRSLDLMMIVTGHDPHRPRHPLRNHRSGVGRASGETEKIMSDDLRNRISRIVHDARRSNEGSDIVADRILAEMGAVRVRELEWEKSLGGGILHSYPESDGSAYTIIQEANRLAVRYGPHLIKVCDDWSDAKAAAQADYETRILAAIEPAPVSVREAARVLLDAVRIEPVHDAIQRSVRPAAFCAALRAIAEGKE